MANLLAPRCVSSAVALFAAAGLGGCGGAHKLASQQLSAQRQVTQTVRSYLGAQTAGDGQAACALLTAGGEQQLITLVMQAAKGLVTTKPSCEEAVTLIRAVAGAKILAALNHARVEQVLVSGTQATAQVVDGGQFPNEQVSLQKVGTVWKIARLPELGG